jgi:hypothetical protein
VSNYSTKAIPKSKPGALPYQTQINAELRKIMEREKSDVSIDKLLRDEKLITALAERIRALV